MNKIVIQYLFLITFTYAQISDNGICGTSCTWSYDKSSHGLKISGSGEMENYSKDVAAPWLYYSINILYVEMSNDITTIGDYAFNQMTSMKKINIPKKCESIGVKAFFNTTTLTSVILPKTIKVLNNESFSHTPEMKSVMFEGNVEPTCGLSVFAYSGVNEIDVSKSYQNDYFCGKKISDDDNSDPYKMIYLCLGIVGGVFILTSILVIIFSLINKCQKPVESGYDLTVL